MSAQQQQDDDEDRAVAQSLRRAGYHTHPERLEKLAEAAWREYPGEGADEGQRRKYVNGRLKEGMLWTLIEGWRPEILGQAVGWFLEEHMPAEVRAAREQRQERGESGTIEIIPPPMRSRPKAVILREQRERQVQTLERAFVKLSRLDSVMIWGRPIGDCTVAEVRSWAEQREQEGREAIRDVRFARNLIANLPSDQRIRDWWKRPDEVDQIYLTAETDSGQQKLLLSDN